MCTNSLPLLEPIKSLAELKIPAHENHAVARATRTWILYYCDARSKGASDASARARAAQAYRLAMPPLQGTRHIRDFIACATQGLLLGAIAREDSSKLLYAAQVAHTARQSKIKSKKRAQKQDFQQNRESSNRASSTVIQGNTTT